MQRADGVGRVWPDKITWIVGLGSTAGLAGQSGTPWMSNALSASAHFSAEQTGLLIGAEMIAMGLSMVAISPFVHRLPAKLMISLALAVILVAEIGSASVFALVPMAIARVIAGIAFGVLFAISSALGARGADPSRTYATAGVIALLIGTTINPMLGYGLQEFGHAGVFGGLAIFCAFVGGALLLFRFPVPTAASAADEAGHASFSWLAAAGVMTVMALLAIAVNGIFVFLTTIAAKVGLAGAGLGAGMSVVSLVSALGGVAAAKLGNSRGVLLPLITGLGAMALALGFLPIVATQAQFWVTFTALVTLFWFLWPYIFGLAVLVDPKGRVAAATGSAKILAGGLGTALSGVITQRFGLPAFGLVAAILCGLAIGVAVLLARRLDAAGGALSAAPPLARAEA